MTTTAYGYSVKARDSHGLDPDTYRVHIGVARRDGKALTAAERKKIEAALRPATAPDDRRPGAAAAKGVPRARTSSATPGKASSKDAVTRPRKATRGPSRTQHGTRGVEG